jgi:hypothetical protein
MTALWWQLIFKTDRYFFPEAGTHAPQHAGDAVSYLC